jgi:hypothetical protein
MQENTKVKKHYGKPVIAELPSSPKAMKVKPRHGPIPNISPVRNEDVHQDRENGDLPGATITNAGRILEEVYGDYVHQNLGEHLDGGITNDAMWQGYWYWLIACPSSTYSIPSGAIGKRFVKKVAEELRGLKSQKWNSKQFILYSLVVLECSRDVKRLHDIRRSIARRIDAWESGEFSMLVEDTL